MNLAAGFNPRPGERFTPVASATIEPCMDDSTVADATELILITLTVVETHG
jgi:hypothetical protein